MLGPDSAAQASTTVLRSALQRGASLLEETSCENKRDAALLLCHSLGKDRAWLLAHRDECLSAAQSVQYDQLLARRQQHEPMQYILGEQEFFGLRFVVTPAVLIPRPETEHLVEAVLARLPRDRPLDIADVGTGSGAIAVALAHALPLAHIDALDISLDALAVAEQNARAHGVEPRVSCRCSDLLSEVADHRFDAIVSNPPYVATAETLEPQVLKWEPHSALFSGPSGLEVYERLIPEAAGLLKPGGLLALEIGYGQRAAIASMLRSDSRWSEPAFTCDLQGIARVVSVTCVTER